MTFHKACIIITPFRDQTSYTFMTFIGCNSGVALYKQFLVIQNKEFIRFDTYGQYK